MFGLHFREGGGNILIPKPSGSVALVLRKGHLLPLSLKVETKMIVILSDSASVSTQVEHALCSITCMDGKPIATPIC